MLFQLFHNPHTLFIVLKPAFTQAAQHIFPHMAKWRMAQVMPQGYRFHQILIQTQRLCDCPGILGYLQRMAHPGPVMVSLWGQKHLRLVF